MARRIPRIALGTCLLASLMVGGTGAAEGATTFTSSSPITITAPAGASTCYGSDRTPQVTAGSPYPSLIPVSGFTGAVTDVNVTLTLTSPHGGDIDVLLAGPGGAAVVLTADNGYDYSASGVVLTFDDAASATLPAYPSPLFSGTYKPSPNGPSGDSCDHPSAFPAPAPAPAGAALSVFDGTDPNGSWALYAISDTYRLGVTTSTISSWSLDITAPTSPAYTVSAFAQPVDNLPALNSANAGSSIPLKFTVTDTSGAPVTDLLLSDVTLSSTKGGDGCSTAGGVDAIETYSGGSGLQNLGNGAYQYNWRTPKDYKGQCRTLTVSFAGATGSLSAGFSFR